MLLPTGFTCFIFWMYFCAKYYFIVPGTALTTTYSSSFQPLLRLLRPPVTPKKDGSPEKKPKRAAVPLAEKTPRVSAGVGPGSGCLCAWEGGGRSHYSGLQGRGMGVSGGEERGN